MLFLLWFKIKQPTNITQKQLMEIWKREAEAAMPAVKAGKIKGLYKVTGRREVVAIIDVNSHEELDEILETLPIVKELGHSLTIEVTGIHPYENFYELMKKLLQ
ncbi:muconolactone Delta-isomerase [Saccharolobus islandicus]|uniref:Muconolactone delta-isomerase n=3 Tax=Saccharolobus islandicus TaxID=43080 RepID=C4KLG3_SACI6|nr:muconolactone Delta-isomerase family protein [Sulfolobus islandicus]ACP39168.1 Muconolactone delta-isomerase [Sulfolobus islandicus M.14.25]ACP56368.1 Muconolactone delta-isomerase [Sulfolobus islandicus M.16.27]ACR43044.1 Muconolactone delta-isomerase [Sulfolobus islandicus M.16.4]